MFCDYTSSENLTDGVIRELITKTTGHECTCNICGKEVKGEWIDENHFVPKCEGQEKEWDILKLDDEEDFCAEWTHKKLLKRLHNHGIDCFFVDMWGSDEMAFITGITGYQEVIVPKVARVLGIHEECIYYDWEHDFMILNLFQEKILRQECKCGDY